MATPPLPAGYKLDQPPPPLPPGYKLDSAPSQPSTWDVLTQPTEKTDKEYLGYTGAAGVAGATIKGLSDVARGTQGAISGMYDMVSHPIDTAKGVAAIPAQAAQVPAAVRDINASPDPVGQYAQAAQDTASQGAGQALTAIVGTGIAKAIPEVKGALPSTARAGAAFREIKAAVGDIPIDVSKVGNSALELWTQSERGSTLPKAVRQLVNRLAKPGSDPITYEEAKDFQSNVSNLSANEKMNLKPNTVRLLGQLNADLKESLADAADTAGKGQQFTTAMREYHQAMKLRGFTDEAISQAWKMALRGAGIYGAAKIFGLAEPQK